MKLLYALERHLRQNKQAAPDPARKLLVSTNNTDAPQNLSWLFANDSNKTIFQVDSEGKILSVSPNTVHAALLNTNNSELLPEVASLFALLGRRAQHNQKIIERNYRSPPAKTPVLKDLSILIIPIRNNETVFIVNSIIPSDSQQRLSLTARTERQNNAIIELTKHLDNGATFNDTLKKISLCCSKILNIDHSGIWLFNDDSTHLVCEQEYDNNQDLFAAPKEIPTEIHSRYFKELANVRLIATNDAIHSPGNTPESKAYLTKNNITAMLDAPIKSDGKYLGVLRLYQQSGTRNWQADEQQFAATISDIITLAHQKQRKSHAMSALRESEDRFKALAESTGAAIFAFNDAIIYANAATENLTGLDQTSLKLLPLPIIFSTVFSKAFNANTLTAQTSPTGIEIEFSRSSGEIRWAYFNVTQTVFAGEKIWLASAFDITERKRAEIQMRYQAFHDNLTSLPNRAQLTKKIDKCLTKSSKDRYYRFALCQFNIENFKQFNEQLGYLSADHFLIDCALKLKKSTRETDNLAKIGADSFLLLRENIASKEAFINDCEALSQELQQPTQIGDCEIECTIFTGILYCDQLYTSSEDVLRNTAIAAEHAEKHRAKKTYLFNEEMQKNALQTKDIASQLRKALTSREFTLHYSPIFNSKAIEYIEPLIHWRGGEASKLKDGHFKVNKQDSRFIKNMIIWKLKTCHHDANQQNLLSHVGVWFDISHDTMQTPEQFDDLFNTIENLERKHSCKKVLQCSLLLLRSFTPERRASLTNELRQHRCELAIEITHLNLKAITELNQLLCTHVKLSLKSIVSEIQNNRNLTLSYLKTLIGFCTEWKMKIHIDEIDNEALSLFVDELIADIESPALRQGTYLGRPQKLNNLTVTQSDIKPSSSA